MAVSIRSYSLVECQRESSVFASDTDRPPDGFYNTCRPETIPVTRRVVVVNDGRSRRDTFALGNK